MVENNKEKLIAKNWVEGDTFALKVHIRKNTKYIYDDYFNEYPKYEGKYLILIHTEDTEWDLTPKNPNEKSRMKLFRAKLCDKIPSTKEEIENIDYIKTEWENYDRELFQFPEIVKKLVPDEHNIIYKYIFELYMEENKTIQGFKYLGNYKISKPTMEYIPNSPHQGVLFCIPKTLVSDLLDSYIGNNLKKNDAYKEEFILNLKETFPEWIESEKRFLKITEALDGPYGKEIMKRMGIDIENEIPTEKETYVGNDKNFKE